MRHVLLNFEGALNLEAGNTNTQYIVAQDMIYTGDLIYRVILIIIMGQHRNEYRNVPTEGRNK